MAHVVFTCYWYRCCIPFTCLIDGKLIESQSSVSYIVPYLFTLLIYARLCVETTGVIPKTKPDCVISLKLT